MNISKALWLYQFLQLILFNLLFFVAYIFPNKKLNKFLSSRSSKNFYYQIELAEQKIEQIQLKTPIYWFHVASAGEMEQAIPVAKKLHQELGIYFFVSYYSDSTITFLMNFPALIGHASIALDTTALYKTLLEKLNITKIFFVRYDIWPAMLFACKEHKIEINLISATKNKTTTGLRAYLSTQWNKILYRYFSNIFVISEDDLIYFKKILKCKNVYLAGDAKWARAYERAIVNIANQNNIKFNNFKNFCLWYKKYYNKKIIVVASAHVHEYELTIKLSEIRKDFFIIYVPHVLEEDDIKKLLVNFNNKAYDVEKYSDFTVEYNENIQLDLLIFNVMGLLAELYQVADIAIIGGGFDGKIHNVLEAAAYGLVTIFGNKYHRSKEAEILVRENAALTFQNIDQIYKFLYLWQTDILRESDINLNLINRNVKKLFNHYPDTSEIIFQQLR